MPRGGAPPWKALAPHTVECMPYIRAALAYGYDKDLQIKGVENGDRATFLTRGLFRAAARHQVAVHVTRKKHDDGTLTLTYQIHDKTKAREYMLERYGTDRTKWPYNPRARSPRDELGNRTDI